METWKPVPGWRWYEASDQGRVRSLSHDSRVGRVLRPHRMPRGHLQIVLSDRANGQMKVSLVVHRLVALAFYGIPTVGCDEVRHLNGVPDDNRLANIEWSTRRRNSQDKKWHAGARTYKLKPCEVREIRQRFADGIYRGLGAELSRIYGVSQAVISKIKLNKLHEDVVL